MSDAARPNPDTAPSLSQCLYLMRQMRMPEHIAAHSIRVTQVSECIATHVRPITTRRAMARIRAAALLHDITKARSFDTGEVHSRTGEVVVTEAGFARVARIVGQHVLLDAFDPDTPIGPEEIVNYADKRVLHDRVVSLKHRMAYIQDRYGGTPKANERIAFMIAQATALEKKIFARLSFKPDDLPSRCTGQRFDRWVARYRGT